MNCNPFRKYRCVFVRMVGKLKKQRMDVDRLPYTQQFEAIYGEFASSCDLPISRSEFFWELVVVRKNFKKLAEKYAAN